MQIQTENLVVSCKTIWEESLSSYPFSTHEVKFHFYKDSTNKFTLTGAAGTTDSNHKFTFNESKTSGSYQVQCIATEKSGNLEAVLVWRGTINILPNLASETDPRSYWRQVYEAYKAAYLKLAARESESVSVLGQSVTYADREQLVRLMNHAQAMADKEAGTPGTTNKIYKSRFRAY